MDSFIEWITLHAEHAHWFIFGAILLAGLNIPVSLDMLVMASALLASNLIPQHTVHLFLSIFLGCYFSAWIAYGVGRFGGKKLLQFSWFQKIFSEEKLKKTETFYKKYGILTFIIGRFIPFGVRNGLFMTAALSGMSFRKFILIDLLASSLWASITFFTCYKLAKYAPFFYAHFQTCSLITLLAFSVTLIGSIWYKRRKKSVIGS